MASQNQQPPFTSTPASALPHTSTTNLTTTDTIQLQTFASQTGTSQVASTSTSLPSTATTPPTSSTQNDKSQFAHTQEYVETFPDWQTLDPHQPSFRKEDFSHDLPAFENVLLPAYKTLVSLVTATSTNGPEDLLASSTDAHFAEFLTNLRDQLRKARECELSVCCVLPIPGKEAGVKLSLQSRLFRTSSRVRRKYETPRLAILLTIAEHWDLPKELITKILGTQIRDDLLKPVIKFNNRTQPLNCSLLNRPKWKVYTLGWCHGIPEWKSGFHMYIWELHQTVPCIERATVLVNQTPEDDWQILILRTSTSDPSLSLPEPFLSESRTMFEAHKGGSRDPADEVASILLSVLETLCRELQSFRDTLVLRISELRMRGRRRPSRHKINFLNHLDDFRQTAQRGLCGAELLLADILGYVTAASVPASPGPPPNTAQALPSVNTSAPHPLQDLADRCKDVKDELSFLACDLDELGKVIVDAREMVKQQMELRQISLSMVLTLLAAIYLPFSFVAGMFGMNVKEPLWPTPHRKHNGTSVDVSRVVVNVSSTTSPAQSTPLSTHDLTSAFADALSEQPSTFLWSFKQFWYIAVAVTVATIFLPIIAAPTFRTVVKFSHKHKELWRVAVFVCAVGGVTSLTVLEGFWVSIVLGAIQGIIAGVGLVRGHLRATRVVRWIAFSAILAGCLLFDFLDVPWLSDAPYSSNNWPSLSGIIPPVWLFVLWMRAGRNIVDVRALEEIPICGPPLARKVLYLINHIKSVQRSPTRKRRLIKASLFGAAATLNATINHFLPSTFYIGLSFVSFGLYAMHKLYWAVLNRKDRIFWSCFAFVTAMSDVWYWMENIGWYLGVSVLIPGLMLWAFHSKETLQPWWEATMKRLQRRDSTNTSSV